MLKFNVCIQIDVKYDFVSWFSLKLDNGQYFLSDKIVRLIPWTHIVALSVCIKVPTID